MSVIYLIMPIALLMGLGFLFAFVRTTLSGQYDDLETPAHRILIDDELSTPPTPNDKKGNA
ncbi:MAG: cbb3-type cytochrome oxidase assembly protein CcoS [Oligoflexia bacterium]|nr:cbb3-type cytochrome oxidase assembly protein CcoS [Oligoflexia bacterium]